MSGKFDPYHEWLGIPVSEQPPNHYRLLAIPAFEESATVIENAADQRMAHLRTFQTGKRAAASQRLLNELAAARICLLNPQKKTAYDQWLRQRLKPSSGQADRAPAPAPPPAPPPAPGRRQPGSGVADRSEPDSFDSGLAAVLATRKTSASAIASRGGGKKSQAKPTALIVAATLTVAAVLLALLAVAFWWNSSGQSGPAQVAQKPERAETTEVKKAPPAKPRPSYLILDCAFADLDGIAVTVDGAPATMSRPGEPGQLSIKLKPGPHELEVNRVGYETIRRGVSMKEGKNLVIQPDWHPAPPKEDATPAVPLQGKLDEKPKPNEESPPAKKLDPPSVDEQKRLIREIDEVYKPGEAKDRAAKTALARKLLEDGRKNQTNRAEQFVMLRRAGEIACEAGEPDLMLEAVDAIAAEFHIQPVQAKSRLLKRLAEQGFPGDVSQLSTFSASCEKFVEEAAASGAVDEASDVLDAARESLVEPRRQAQKALRTARTAAARVRNPAEKAAWERKSAEAQAELEEIDFSLASLTDCAKGFPQARREHEAILEVQERLKTAPDDPDACLAVGRWYCFRQSDWDEGLKLLAKGTHGPLQSLAAEELASKPSKPEERVARGDAWWDLAEKAAGKSKAAIERRAGYWYRKAMPELTPELGKSRVEKRLARAAEEPRPETRGGSARTRPPLAAAPFDEKAAKRHQARWAKYLGVAVIQTNSIGMKLVLIPPGEFDMGSPKERIEELKAHTDNESFKGMLSGEEPQHRVRITRPFYLGMYDVTQEEYQRVVGSNPSDFSATGKAKDTVAGQDTQRFPVENVSWDDAVEFCRKLAKMPEEKAAGRQYRLPSEAHWEYACRAGSTGRSSFSSGRGAIPEEDEEHGLSDCAWFNGNSGGRTHEVGGKRANAWGLYDVHGNVWQWCQDLYDKDYYAKSPADDPTGPGGGSGRVFRGGCWRDTAGYCRSALRNYGERVSRGNNMGLRVFLVTPDN